MCPHLARICLYPIKSLDPIEVSEAVALRTGGLAHDREYCLQDCGGLLLNSKNLGDKLITIRSDFHLSFGELVLRADGKEYLFRLPREKRQLEQWFTRRLGQPVSLARKISGGFPEDEEVPGPTVVSTATIEETASWFTKMTTEEIRRRFRPNLEIDGVPAFWEDHLFAEGSGKVSFRIGDTAIDGVKPCARCIVPQRDSFSGKANYSSFAKIFAEQRAKTLPAWTDRSCFDHFYCLSTNAVIPESESGKVLHVGDPVILSDFGVLDQCVS